MIKSILLHNITLHDPVYIIMAWKRHLVTLGTLVIFAQLKVIYERQKNHILRVEQLNITLEMRTVLWCGF